MNNLSPVVIVLGFSVEVKGLLVSRDVSEEDALSPLKDWSFIWSSGRKSKMAAMLTSSSDFSGGGKSLCHMPPSTFAR